MGKIYNRDHLLWDIEELREFKNFLEDNFVERGGGHPGISKICGTCFYWRGELNGIGICRKMICMRNMCIFDEGEESSLRVRFRAYHCPECEYYNKLGQLAFDNGACGSWYADPGIAEWLMLFGLLGLIPKVSRCKDYIPLLFDKAQKGEWNCGCFDDENKMCIMHVVCPEAPEGYSHSL